MGILADSNARHKRFHAEIARKASLLVPKPDRSYSIPNTPFGVAKPAPEIIKHVIEKSKAVSSSRNRMADWYHCMWFFQLIEEDETRGVPQPGTEYIQETVAAFYGLSRSDLISHSRIGKLIRPRHIAIFLCRQWTKRSLSQIGRRFGGRDHATILHGIKKIERDLMTDQKLADDIESLTALVQL